MTLADASTAALTAAQLGDWDALERALEARASALAAAAAVEPAELHVGDEIRAAVLAWRAQLVHQEGRLRQLATTIALSPAAPHVDLQG